MTPGSPLRDAGPAPAGPTEGPPSAAGRSSPLEDLEIRLLLQGIYERYGYDFRDYALPSVRRRIRHCLADERLPTVSALQARVLHDPAAHERLVGALSVSVTGLFRQPGFFRAFRERALPILRTYPVIRIWHAGCATGEEVYSMAVLLEEEGLYQRAQLYATDMSARALAAATAGSFPLAAALAAEEGYRRAGGRGRLSAHYVAAGDRALFASSLRRNVVFAQHNLATDRSFNEFNAIVCRNVLIYFNRALQARVHALLHASLGRRGFLGLGDRETIRFTPLEDRYEVVDAPDRLYRKVG